MNFFKVSCVCFWLYSTSRLHGLISVTSFYPITMHREKYSGAKADGAGWVHTAVRRLDASYTLALEVHLQPF